MALNTVRVMQCWWRMQVVHSTDLIGRLQRAHAQGISLVLVPTHRSHLDYLLISYAPLACTPCPFPVALLCSCCSHEIDAFRPSRVDIFHLCSITLLSLRSFETGTFVLPMDYPCPTLPLATI